MADSPSAPSWSFLRPTSPTPPQPTSPRNGISKFTGALTSIFGKSESSSPPAPSVSESPPLASSSEQLSIPISAMHKNYTQLPRVQYHQSQSPPQAVPRSTSDSLLLDDWCVTKNVREVDASSIISSEAGNSPDADAEWEVMIANPSCTVPQNTKKKAFFSLMQTAKTKLYNMYRSYPSEPPSFSFSPIYMLGTTYQPEICDKANHAPQVKSFLEDFSSRIWLTYRCNFPAIDSTTITTDMGWGCMLRTGQMMLAQAFVIFFLTREFRLRHKENNPIAVSMERAIIKWFADSSYAPYSIHSIAQYGTHFEKKIGEWFEPTITARVLKHLLRKHRPGDINMYVPSDCVLYKSTIVSICASDLKSSHTPPTNSPIKESLGDSTSFGPWSPIIILVPLRLGVEKVNRSYVHALKAYFSFPQSLGILGGKPDFSLYFVATQDDYLFYLDPHLVHESVDIERPDFPTDSFHCQVPQKILIADIDPSMAIGFFCKDRADFIDFCNRLETLNSSLPPESLPVLHMEAQPHEYETDSSSTDESDSERQLHVE